MTSIKEIFPDAKHEIVHAFDCGGVAYYNFADFNNMPPLRGLKTMVFYTEMQMKMTVEYLNLHVAAVDNILMSEKINIYEIKKLNDQMKQRLEIAIDIEQVMKIASIVFFDKDENYTDYDFAYNSKKVENWKKHDGLDFFLKQPIQELMPILKDMGENLRMYSEAVETINAIHLENLLKNLPDQKKMKLNGKYSTSQMGMQAK